MTLAMPSFQTMAWALAVALAGSACQTTPEFEFTPEQIDRAIQTYLDCDECSNHQLHHVVIIGEAAKAPLEALVDNPADALPTGFEASLRSRITILKARYPEITIGSDAYVRAHVTARISRIRARSAKALNLINIRWMPESRVRELRYVGVER